jgi:hypothetical protein
MRLLARFRDLGMTNSVILLAKTIAYAEFF